MSKTGVYLLIDKRSSQFYVGSTSNLSDRISHHKRTLNRGEHSNPTLQVLYNSEPNLPFNEKLDVVRTVVNDRETAFDLEQSIINEFLDSGYLLNRAKNARSPGEGITISDEGKRKLSELKTGVKMSDDARAKMSAFQRGKIISEEQRIKMSEALKGRTKNPEHVRKVAESHFKPVSFNGVEYKSISEFASANNLSMATASRRAQKLRGGNG